jgi:hypothetical protein
MLKVAISFRGMNDRRFGADDDVRITIQKVERRQIRDARLSG